MGYKVCLDAGHGGKDPGAVGKNGEYEKNFTLDAVLKIGEMLQDTGVSVTYTRKTDEYLELSKRASIANAADVDAFVSVHMNSAEKIATGTETFHYPGSESGKALASRIQGKIDALRLFTSRGVKSANFAVLRETKMKAALVELCFINNPEDVAVLRENFTAVCGAIALAILDDLKEKQPVESGAQTPVNLISIEGRAIATAGQMESYLLASNREPKLPFCTVYELAEMFLSEGEAENIRGDIAWCQSLKETGFFKYGGIVNPEQNNYAGIGALNNNANGQCAAFDTPLLGVRAQIQHLKAYANKSVLTNECVDPRFGLVSRGTAPYVEWLGKADNPNGAGWAVPGDGYGASILKILDSVLAVPKHEEPAASTASEGDAPKLPDWQMDGLNELIAAGIIGDEKYWLNRMELDKAAGDFVGLLGKAVSVICEATSARPE